MLVTRTKRVKSFYKNELVHHPCSPSWNLLVQSQQCKLKNKVWNLLKADVIGVVLVSLLLFLNRFHTLPCCFHCWLWISKCWQGPLPHFYQLTTIQTCIIIFASEIITSCLLIARHTITSFLLAEIYLSLRISF